jgi:hypothetical protein
MKKERKTVAGSFPSTWGILATRFCLPAVWVLAIIIENGIN